MQITFFIDTDGTVTISDLLAEVAPLVHALAPDDPRVQTAMRAHHSPLTTHRSPRSEAAMPMEQIEYLIKPDGTVEERVVGIPGVNCEQATSPIEAKLGAVEKREHTPEYYQQQAAQQQWQKV
jgi:hypothetical protein